MQQESVAVIQPAISLSWHAGCLSPVCLIRGGVCQLCGHIAVAGLDPRPCPGSLHGRRQHSHGHIPDRWACWGQTLGPLVCQSQSEQGPCSTPQLPHNWRLEAPAVQRTPAVACRCSAVPAQQQPILSRPSGMQWLHTPPEKCCPLRSSSSA